MIEMMVAMLASSVMFLAVTGVLAGNHRQWNQTYERVYGPVVTDAYLTRITFDRIVRQASKSLCDPTTISDPSTAGPVITVYLYTNVSTYPEPPLNRYARFTYNGSALILEQGPLDSSTMVTGDPDSTQTLAHHVTACSLWRSGPCIHLQMTLNDGKSNLPVAVTAKRHNP